MAVIPAPGRKIQVHQNHVGPVFAEQLNGLFTERHDSHEIQIGVEMNQKGEAFADQWIVIHSQYPNLACLHSLRSSQDPVDLDTPETRCPDTPGFGGLPAG
jgi:hypothetical protein